jgi:hypothetical protein
MTPSSQTTAFATRTTKPGLLRAIGGWSFRHRRIVLGLWAAALIVLIGLSHTIGTAYNDSFSLPNTDSYNAQLLLQKAAPKTAGDVDQIVVATSHGKITDRGQCVIELAREPDGGSDLVRLDPRRVKAQDGHVLADGVHLADARVEVKERRSHRRGVLDRAHQLHFGLVTGQDVKIVGSIEEGPGGEVLLDGDDAVVGDHGCCPFR